jgi:hypothetical protein
LSITNIFNQKLIKLPLKNRQVSSNEQG